MSDTLKYILSFIVALSFIALGFYALIVYDSHKNREYDLTAIEIQNNHIIDSLTVKSFHDSITVANLLTAKETEKVTRNNYAENKIKRDKEIYSNPVDVNRVYNDKFIYNFSPKYR